MPPSRKLGEAQGPDHARKKATRPYPSPCLLLSPLVMACIVLLGLDGTVLLLRTSQVRI